MKLVRVALPVVALSLTLAGCGHATSTGTPPAPASAMSTTAMAPLAGAPASTATSSPCPTTNTTSFAKTRFVGDIGLAAGSFHRYIYKPWQAGTFKKGAPGRVLALVKASATAAADAKLLSNAVQNAEASPALCNAVYVPMTAAESAFADLKGKLTSGDLSSIPAIESQVQSVIAGSTSAGNPISEKTG